VWFDSVCNALGHGVKALLVSLDEQYTSFMARLSFDCTNNIVEYEACALGSKRQLTSRSSCSRYTGTYPW